MPIYMSIINRFISQYTGILRRFKLFYVINNLLHTDQLRHNKALYKKYAVQKSVFNAIGSQDFKNKSPKIPWLNRADAKQKLQIHPEFNKFDLPLQQQMLLV